MKTKRKLRMPRCPRHWTVEQRLAHYTKVDPISGCHIWQSAVRDTGYGQLRMNGRNLLPHRLAWAARHGPIPKGMVLCHRCDERRCINPDHLFAETQAVNMVDRIRKDRARRKLAFADHRANDDLAIVRLYYRGVHMKGELTVEPFDPDAVLARPSAHNPKRFAGSTTGRNGRRSRRGHRRIGPARVRVERS